MRWPYLLLVFAPFLESFEAVILFGIVVGCLLMMLEYREDKEK